MAQKYRVNARASDSLTWIRETAGTINAYFRDLTETSDGLTAGTPTGQANALGLKLGFNRVTTAVSGSGVMLPPPEGGDECVIRNEGANALKVWPTTGAKIDSGSANAADSATIANGAARTYRAISADEWCTIGNT